MNNRTAGLVLVGNRTAAIDNACQRYEHVVQLADKPARLRPQDNLSLIEMPPDDDLAVATVADCISQRVQPLGVVAVTESTVVLAARLREALELDGLSVAAARACTDKVLMKRAARAAGIHVTPFVTADDDLEAGNIVTRLGLPLVLKRATGSGGRDLRVIENAAQFPGELPPGWMAEAFIDGVEMSVESFVSAGEPCFVNFTAYAEPRWANIVPADPESVPVDELIAFNRRVIDVLQIERGMTHMEVFRTRDGLVLGEVAVRPPGGRIMELIELAYGFDPWAALFALEAGDRPEFPIEAQRVAGMRLVHPGPGTVIAVEGMDAVRRQPGLVRLHCSAKPGKRLTPRKGAGQSAGYALFAGSRAEVEAGLASVRNHLRIVVR